MLNSIQVNCTSLEKLTLKNLESVTHEALTHLISHLQVDHLEKLNLHRLVQIKDEIIMILIQRCALKLEVLDINGLDELSEVCLMELSLLSKLRTLDVSFIRNFTDNCMMTLMAKSIQSVRVFGVHKLTDTLLNGVWKNGSGESIRLIGNEFD